MLLRKPSCDWLIVGLGNPGPSAPTAQQLAKQHSQVARRRTRRQPKRASLRLAERLGTRLDRAKFRGLYGQALWQGQKLILLKPQTFMNASGLSVMDAARFYKLPPEKCLICVDDISLPVGTIRIRRKGSDAGQRGMRSIITLSGSDQFPRIKIGVGKKPHPDYDLAAWVLGHFSEEDQKALVPVLDHSYEAVQQMIAGKIDRAMNLFN